MSSCDHFALYYPWFEIVAYFDFMTISNSPLMTNGGMQLYLAAEGVTTLTPDVAPHRVGDQGVLMTASHAIRVPSLSLLDPLGWSVNAFARLDC